MVGSLPSGKTGLKYFHLATFMLKMASCHEVGLIEFSVTKAARM